MTLATMPELAAEYYVCVSPDDVDNTLQQVRRDTEGWVDLKGSFEEAFSRYCWRFPDRAALEAGLAHVMCLRLSLTHVEQAALYLGHVKMVQGGWSQHPILRTWTSSSARFHGDLPMRVVSGNGEVWKCEARLFAS